MSKARLATNRDLIRVAVDHRVHAQLSLLAAARGLDEEEYAGWLLGRCLELLDVTGISQPEKPNNRIAQIIQSLASRVEALERASHKPVRRGRDAGGSQRADGGGNDTAAAAPARTSLHDEIARTLRAAGKPLSASEIAETIRRSGSYAAPRTGRAVTGALVSSRVSNPQYRDLFGHADRKITLAEWAPATTNRTDRA